ncbi:MAG: STAS domain-containing protein [Acidimicrobiia bacterium]
MKKLTSKPAAPLGEPSVGQIPPFEVLTMSSDGEVVVSVHGEIDMATAPHLWEHLAGAIPGATHRLVVDLRDTPFIDSTGLAVFVRALKRVRHQGSEFVLRSPQANARKILRVTGLDRVMTITDSSDAPAG